MLKDFLRECGQELVCVEPDAKISEVAKQMEEKDVGCVLVLTNGRLRGIMTDRDIVLRCVAENLDVNDTTVENVMTESPLSCNETDGVFDCIRMMKKGGVRRMPVIDSHGNAVGIISFGDLVRVLSQELISLAEGCTRPEHIQATKPLKKVA